MNVWALYHMADSSYCFPVSDNELVLRLRTAKNDIKDVSVLYESKYIIGGCQKKQNMEKQFSDSLYDYYVTKLLLTDTRVGYVFYINDGKDKYYYSEDGLTETYDFKQGFYNFFQYPYINPADVMNKVDWMGKACFYQIFVDRFKQGIAHKDISYINCEWGDIPSPFTHAGGDLKGITEKLDYIKSLGCNVIYLTPVFKSKSNHKYDISDYYEIDEQFGTNEDLHELVETAHGKNMKIVLDAVFNHCSEDIMQFRDVCEKGKNSKYYNWFIIHGDSVNADRDNYEIFGGCKYMPKWNTGNESAAEYLINIAVHYLKAYDIDGWRLDVSDEVSHAFWREFRKAVKKSRKDAIILGENWHNAYSNLRGDQFDGIMNYSFTKACLDYFAYDKFTAGKFADRLNEILMRNTDIVNYMMLNLLDSHDTHRFYSEVSCNDFRFEAAICLTYMFPGAPCIFYGTEIRMEGGYDPDCRRCMDWDKKDDRMKTLLNALSELRKKYEIADGSVSIYSRDENFVLEIVTKKNKIILEINKETEKYGISVDGGNYI